MKTIPLSFLGLFLILCAVSASEDYSVLSLDALTSKHIGKTIIIQTNIQSIVILGSLPPDGMITWNEKENGNIYKGRLDAIAKDSITISAFAGVPSDPEYRKTAQIEKGKIKEIKIQMTEPSGSPKPLPPTAPEAG